MCTLIVESGFISAFSTIFGFESSISISIVFSQAMLKIKLANIENSKIYLKILAFICLSF
jgi:hypothetical protein